MSSALAHGEEVRHSAVSHIDVCDRGGSASPRLGDVNGDGLIDLVVGTGDGSVLLYLNEGAPAGDGGPEFPPPPSVVIDAGVVPLSPADLVSEPGGLAVPSLVDFDGDGLLEMVVGWSNGTLSCLDRADVSAVWQATRIDDCPVGHIQLPGDAAPTFGDLNADGLPDLLVGTGGGTVWRWDNVGTQSDMRFVGNGSAFATGETVPSIPTGGGGGGGGGEDEPVVLIGGSGGTISGVALDGSPLEPTTLHLGSVYGILLRLDLALDVASFDPARFAAATLVTAAAGPILSALPDVQSKFVSVSAASSTVTFQLSTSSLQSAELMYSSAQLLACDVTNRAFAPPFDSALIVEAGLRQVVYSGAELLVACSLHPPPAAPPQAPPPDAIIDFSGFQGQSQDDDDNHRDIILITSLSSIMGVALCLCLCCLLVCCFGIGKVPERLHVYKIPDLPAKTISVDPATVASL